MLEGWSAIRCTYNLDGALFEKSSCTYLEVIEVYKELSIYFHKQMREDTDSRI